MGHFSDDVALLLLYNAADVMVVPSRQEAFGQTASEALACGTPVVAFRTSGLVDVVEDRVTGYLAEPFDTDDLATGLNWVLAEERTARLRADSRARAVRLWSPEVVVAQHRELYRSLVGKNHDPV